MKTGPQLYDCSAIRDIRGDFTTEVPVKPRILSLYTYHTKSFCLFSSIQLVFNHRVRRFSLRKYCRCAVKDGQKKRLSCLKNGAIGGKLNTGLSFAAALLQRMNLWLAA
jgi:hypothetical protein